MEAKEYYDNIYKEENRLGADCDNRHKVEKINKAILIDGVCLRFRNEREFNVLDIGAGTGLWTEYIHTRYPNARIVCGDISDRHNQIMEQKFSKSDCVKVVPMNALYLGKFVKDRYDVVLCGGALYHLNYTDSKKVIYDITCFKNAYCMVDWLSETSGELNWSFMKGSPVLDLKKEDKTFYYLTTTKLEQLLRPYKDRIEIHGHYGVDSISRFVTDRINGYNDDELEQYCSIIRKSWDKNADCSEHSITVWKNM